MEFNGLEFTIHNQREEIMCLMVIDEINCCIKYHKEHGDKFGTTEFDLISYYATKINGMLHTLFFMDIIKKPLMVSQLEYFKDYNIFNM